MIVSYEGRMGQGKTLSAVAMAYLEWFKREIQRTALQMVLGGKTWDEVVAALSEKFKLSEKSAENQILYVQHLYEMEGEEAFLGPRKIICNDHLNFPYTHFDPDYFLEHLEDEEMIDCILIMDEAYQMGLDSRSSSTKYNKLMTYFIAQSRKRGVDLYICTHHIDAIDKRVRRHIDIRGTCRFSPGPLEEHKEIKNRRYNWARVTLRDMRSGFGKRMKFYGPAFWPLYDTLERIPFMAKQMEVEV